MTVFLSNVQHPKKQQQHLKQMMIEQIKLEVKKCKGKREKILRYLASLTILIVILIIVFASTQLKVANRTMKVKMPL